MRGTSTGGFQVKVKAVSSLMGTEIPFPSYATEGSAGLDLAACTREPIVIPPGGRKLIPTGVAVQLPGPHVGAFIFARSGLAAQKGVHLANGVGVIDSDYTGEILCALENGGDEPFHIDPGDRVAQMVFLPVIVAQLAPVDTLDETERGDGGFGHTGIS